MLDLIGKRSSKGKLYNMREKVGIHACVAMRKPPCVAIERSKTSSQCVVYP